MKTTALSLIIALLFTMGLHAQKTVKASDILSNIKNGKDVKYENVTIVGSLDMTYMDEKLTDLPKRKRWYKNGYSNTVEEQINGKVVFINCVFEDHVYAYIHDEDSKYTFVANFENDVQFVNCLFKGKAYFKYSDFERNVDFSGSKFKDQTTFKYAKFNTKADFSNTYFDEDATFKYSEFRRGVNFNNAEFKGELNLKYTKVRGDFDANGMDVSYDIDSKYTDINGSGLSKYLLKNN